MKITTCVVCGTEFKSKSNKAKYCSKSCINEKMREYLKINYEKYKETKKRYYENHKEDLKKKSKQYYLKNSILGC